MAMALVHPAIVPEDSPQRPSRAKSVLNYADLVPEDASDASVSDGASEFEPEVNKAVAVDVLHGMSGGEEELRALVPPPPALSEASAEAGPSVVRAIPRKRASVAVSAEASSSKPPSSEETKRNYPSRTQKRFKCTHEGCEKAYTKPSRLAEHEMTHRGERPYKCVQCDQAYSREDHLKAHARTHLKVEVKPFPCTEQGCTQSFWTPSKLKRHLEVHDKERTYKCDHCDAMFNKHILLREHVVVVHMPAGTKPFICSHEDCSASFSLKAHLKTHEKTHDPKRFTCAHPSHTDDLPIFSKWSEFQKHMTDAHPPTCPHPECNNRTFKSNARLRDHLKVHAEQEADRVAKEAREAVAVNGQKEPIPQLVLEGMMKSRRKRKRESAAADDDKPKKLKKAEGDAGKDHACDWMECEKRFKTKYAMETHRNVVHLKIRSHTCPHADCDKAYAHKATLMQHLSKHDTASPPGVDGESNGGTSGPSSRPASRRGSQSEGTMLTGAVRELRRFVCPAWALGSAPPALETASQTALDPNIDPTLQEDKHGNEQLLSILSPIQGEGAGISGVEGETEGEQGRCISRFWRVYDVRRHLKSEHGMELEDLQVRMLLVKTGQDGT
ncbi:hypothetical protein I350_04555 [Cryptococcus amylolentus CBS 6273]|uniref:C2H2-type domain-containing protein n=1 Tax=Cryptococcus amylolentus CBS 6273 TaxID=1296118 RepID=A0A1E3JXA9_9TREE|nr:hypothetical protein I350_04555 [Cryptococcus amylolentus CBS 6273]